jgi:GntR family transcriptional repressor for pyruvate dehydrogenase complex
MKDVAVQVQRVRPAYQQVADELRVQIVAGGFAAGRKLPNQEELCAMFGVSRSTVREGLRVLESEHLVETIRGTRGGTFVVAPDPQQMVETLTSAVGRLTTSSALSLENLLEARLLVEAPAARLAAQRADRAAIEAVRAAAAPQPTPDGGPPTLQHHIDSLQHHTDFHLAVLVASGNLMFLVMEQPIIEVMRHRPERANFTEATRRSIGEHHVGIAEAIAAHDGERAESLMAEHLAELRDAYLGPAKDHTGS